MEYSQQTLDKIMLVRLGRRIVGLRGQKGMLQEELAIKAGIDRSYLSKIENGRTNVSIGTLHWIAQVLGTTISKLLDGLG